MHRLLAFSSLLLAVACSSDSVTDNRTFVGLALSVSPTADTLYLGGQNGAESTVMLAATATAQGSSIQLPGHVFESADSSIATVDVNGIVTARKVGTTTVSVRVNDVKASTTIVVLGIVKEIILTPPPAPLIVGDTLVLATSVRGWRGQVVSGQEVTYSSSSAIAVVSPTGWVVFSSSGTATITARTGNAVATISLTALPIVKSLTLAAPLTQVLVGDTVPLTVVLLGQKGQSLSGLPITYSSSGTIATVSPTGRVTFTAPGSVTITARSGETAGTITFTAQPREFIGNSASSLSSGLDATCGLAAFGRAFCFGKAPVTGIARDTTCFDIPGTPGDPKPCSLVALPIAASIQFATLAVGDSVACGIATGGRLYCWGDQTYGQVGNGVSRPGTSALPTPVTGPLATAAMFTQVTAGGTHACGLVAGGAALCWGRDTLFQIGGNGDFLPASSSTPIPAGGQNRFVAITAGHAHTCGLNADGIAICWGDNRKGQLGRGVISGPSDLALPVSGPAFTQISAHGDNTCGLTASQAVFCWGANEFGQTGQSAPLPSATPSPIAGGGYSFVAVGGQHACAMTASGASCWGSNQYGQLGRGFALGSATAPDVVAGTRTFTALSSGSRTSCAVATDGGTFCWGSSIYGATGTEIQASAVVVPTRIAPLR